MQPWLFYDFDKAEHFAGAVLFLAVPGRQVKGVLCGEKLHDLEAAFVEVKALNALILETIRTTASYAIQNKEEFIQKVCSISQVRQQEAAKELKRKVAKDRKRSAELDVLIKKLYETYAMGKLEEKRFELLCAEYEKEQAELEQLLVSEQAQLDQFHEDTDRASHFLALAQKYTDFTELTAPMLHEFVEKILVHAPDRSTGERVQEIEIYLNFIGKFEVPMPEPTEEELAAEEKRRQKRIRDHEKYLRQKERKQMQAKHRLEEAQARDRVKERKARTRRLIQEGAVLEKVLPEVQAVGLDNLEEYLRRKLAAHD